MKIIGLIGGTTWVSTLEYYRIINQIIQKKMGGTHSAHCILYSIDFEETIRQHLPDWKKISEIFIDIALKLEQVGCETFALCANTPHIIAENIERHISIPLIHIVDSTSKKIHEKNVDRVGLIGSKYTMGEAFYKQRLREIFGIDTIVPTPSEQKIIHDIIINELAYEIKNRNSKKKYLQIINSLINNGAEGIIIGCTEIPLLINEKDLDIPIFDTTTIHAKAIAEYALQ